MTRTFRSAIFLQFIGTIGSGIFVLPYVFYHSNLLFASIFLIFLALVTGALNQFYCTIVSSTPGDHQLGGYAKIYLGSRFQKLAILNLLLLGIGASTAYLKLFSSFLPLLFPISPTTASLIFIGLLFFFYFSHLSFIFSRLSFLIPALIIFIPIILLVVSLSTPYIPYTISQFPNFSFYGPAFFALSGFTIIPEIDELLRKGKSKKHETLSLASILGLFLVVIIYLSFIYGIISLSGDNLSVNSLSGLAKNMPFLGKTVATFGLVITLKASINFLKIYHEVFFRDLKSSHNTSTLLSFVFPLLSLFLSTIPLISIISITGEITIFISALIIILIRLKLPRTFWTDFFSILILLCLLLGFFISSF